MQLSRITKKLYIEFFIYVVVGLKVKKSMTVTEAANARFGTANARGGQAKTPANPLASTTFNH